MDPYTTLRDGRTVSVRPLDSNDRPLVVGILESMSDNARYHRFLRPMPRIGNDIVDALSAADGVNHLAVIATDGETPAGMARVVTTASEAELAVEISDAYTGAGLGRYLTQTVLAMAADRGLTEVGLYVAPYNTVAHRLFTSLGARFHYEDGLLVGNVSTRPLSHAA